jgi:2-polyprenyl-3-methyl-5-hydroxy-6-metoxy-1,4-benzoquinol methylase
VESDKARAIALKKQFHLSKILRLESHSFDVITMWHVLEHVPNLDNQIKELKRLLKPSGTLIVAVLKSSMQNITEFWAAYDVPIFLALF